jgi:hypothetical protein
MAFLVPYYAVSEAFPLVLIFWTIVKKSEDNEVDLCWFCTCFKR